MGESNVPWKGSNHNLTSGCLTIGYGCKGWNRVCNIKHFKLSIKNNSITLFHTHKKYSDVLTPRNLQPCQTWRWAAGWPAMFCSCRSWRTTETICWKQEGNRAIKTQQKHEDLKLKGEVQIHDLKGNMKNLKKKASLSDRRKAEQRVMTKSWSVREMKAVFPCF